MNHGLDNDGQVFFYEQDFYVLSNFSAFTLQWGGFRFDTSEAAYHHEKFRGFSGDPHDPRPLVQAEILHAPSAHEAYRVAQRYRDLVRVDWADVRVGLMGEILRAKVAQHTYVRRKLLETGDRELVENSWRDEFWGWGADRSGRNQLGRLWMEIRAEIRADDSSGLEDDRGVAAAHEHDRSADRVSCAVHREVFTRTPGAWRANLMVDNGERIASTVLIGEPHETEAQAELDHERVVAALDERLAAAQADDREVIRRHAGTIALLRSEARLMYSKLRTSVARLSPFESTESDQSELSKIRDSLRRLGVLEDAAAVIPQRDQETETP